MHHCVSQIGKESRSRNGTSSKRTAESVSLGERSVKPRVATYPKIQQVHQSPADFLSHSWDSVDDDLPGEDENGVDEPCTWRTIQGPSQSRAGKARERRRTFAIHPLRVQVVIYALV